MVAQNVPFTAFNRGLVTRLALARTDLKRTGLAAEVMTNWAPRVLGSMMLRPGTNFLGDTQADNPARCIDFVRSLAETAVLELTDSTLRVWVNDVLVTRVAVSTAVTNGTFAGSLASWTNLDEAPNAVSAFAAPNAMVLTGDGFNYAIREQQVAVAGADLGKEHALRIVIGSGPVILTVGSSSGADDYITRTSLDAGTHSLAFTPTTNFWIRFKAVVDYGAFLTNCTVEPAGVMSLPTPWLAADLDLVRYDQSIDIVYIASDGAAGPYQQRAIERRGVHSWSVVTYAPLDGPFLVENVTNIGLKTTTISGSAIAMSATKPIFYPGHVGALFRITSNGQLVAFTGQTLDSHTDPVKVTGVGTDRNITVTVIGISATGTTVDLERSDNPDSGWGLIAAAQHYAVDQAAVTFNDTLDNQVWYYRLRISTYVAGTPALQISSAFGAITGIVKVVAFVSSTVVNVNIIQHLGQQGKFSNIWSEGAWSTFRGFPSSVRFDKGRLCWAGKGTEWGSVSDGFYSFDDTVLGDSGPFSRSIGNGPLDSIGWMLSLQRLLLGGALAEYETITSTLDEPITPTNFSIRKASTMGANAVQAVELDQAAIYVRRGGTRLMRLAMDPVKGDYGPEDLTALVPELFGGRLVPLTDMSIKRIAVQRLPDTRVHCVRADGQVGILVFDPVEQVLCWVQYQTSGFVEDVVVLPVANGLEDAVYYVVRRVINGVTKRFRERWALESEARGATITKLADACLLFQGAPATVFAVPHLTGRTVAVWADGKDVGTNDDYTYSLTVDGSGNLTLPVAASTVVIGLPYTAQWQSTKLAYAAQLGTALLQEKRVPGLGVIMADTHWKGLRFGKDFSTLDPLPLTEDVKPVAPDSIWDEYDKPSFDFDGDWDTDSRVCLQAQSPRCCTLLGLVATLEMYEKT